MLLDNHMSGNEKGDIRLHVGAQDIFAAQKTLASKFTSQIAFDRKIGVDRHLQIPKSSSASILANLFNQKGASLDRDAASSSLNSFWGNFHGIYTCTLADLFVHKTSFLP
jgi:hypothetical protein